MIKLSTIRKNPKNPRIIKDDKFMSLVESINEFPKMMPLRPIIVDDDNMILGGNMRYKALQELGYTEIPKEWVKKASDLTPEEVRRFIITDNISYGEWDGELLLDGWTEAELEGWGLDVPEFEVEENHVEEDEFEMPEKETIQTTIKFGDFIEIGEHRLLCGDSRNKNDYQVLMMGEKADLIVTDPPYNVNYTGGTKEKLTIQNDNMEDQAFYQFLLEYYKAQSQFTKNGGAFYIWHASSEIVNFAKAFQDAGLLLKQQLIWAKSSMVLGRQDYQWKHEACLYGWKAGGTHYFTPERFHTTLIENDELDYSKMKKAELLKIVEAMYSEETIGSIIRADKPTRNSEHPTMKPILLLAPLIKNSSRRNEIVCDAFAGSGSTMVTAHQLGRRCYAMEIDPKYCQVIIDRMIELDDTLEVRINGEDYFTQEAEN